MPNVKHISRERHEVPLSDIGPYFIGAKALWEGTGSPWPWFKGTAGEGAVIAVLDTGINHDHPSFADIGGDGYDHNNPLGAGNYISGSYCDVEDPSFCNDKLIGAWDMVQSAADPGAPEDSDGHGSHTAGTAAGNFVRPATLRAPTTQFNRKVTGVAPHANIIAYDVCIETCPGAALLAAVEQVVEDASTLPNGIHSLNYSISGGTDPYNDPVELAFLDAAEAGIFVSASAGNDGPGPNTVAHNSPWVTSVGATTHTRSLDSSLVGLTSNNGAAADILGAGFTAGYGPASIIYAGDYPTNNGSTNDTNPAQCLEPFPAGHFNGEIVICDRGEIARVEKGQNVQTGGAGGFVLANDSANGESTVADGHFLPGVHIGYTDGETLKAWVASSNNPVASISGVDVNSNKSNADIMAGFSSRGPNLSGEVLKPDVSAPGVSIMAANASLGAIEPEYQFLSGTSMASPHNAGAGALVRRATQGKDWTPFEVKSAFMLTSNPNVSKEDGTTPADAFDTGAGRINLNKVLRSGLVLNETKANFLAADPEEGGDPSTLNIASMQSNNCVEECSWTRTVTNRSLKRNSWTARGVAGDSGMKITVKPSSFTLGAGRSRVIEITADTSKAQPGWQFAKVNINPQNSDLANLHMPMAVQVAHSTSAVLSKTVDKATSVQNDILNYTITVQNGQLADPISIEDVLPAGFLVVQGSETETVTGGTSIEPFAFSSRTEGSWTGTLDVSTLSLAPTASSPAGFLPLSALGVTPFGCPANCDDGGVLLDVPSFTYNGQSYNSVIWSINGTLEIGTDSGSAISAGNTALPNAATPNNLLAPLWTDLNMGQDGDGAEWYVGVLSDGAGGSFTVYEWSNISLYGAAPGDPTYSFQIWVQNGTSGNIWYTYGSVGDVSQLNATVGLENASGTIGHSFFYDGQGVAPTTNDELIVNIGEGGKAVLEFQAIAKRCRDNAKTKTNHVTLSSDDVQENAIAVTQCSRR